MTDDYTTDDYQDDRAWSDEKIAHEHWLERLKLKDPAAYAKFVAAENRIVADRRRAEQREEAADTSGDWREEPPRMGSFEEKRRDEARGKDGET